MQRSILTTTSALEEMHRLSLKFDLVQDRCPFPKYKNDYEYVDYVLVVLNSAFETTTGVFANSLERHTSALVKSNVKSADARNIGNSSYKDGNWGEACRLYSISVSYAEMDSKELALAYGNRSAVLFEMRFYKECLADIERALSLPFPEDKKAKLLSRQGIAKERLNTQEVTPYHGPIPHIKNKNPHLPAASSCIKVEKNTEFGRHLVATRDISPGQLLLVEKPYAQVIVLDLESRVFHCSECLELCHNLLPCEECSAVLYCSKTCSQKAFDDYHRYECAVFRHFGFDIINWLSLRMTLKGIKENGLAGPLGGSYAECSKLFTEKHNKKYDPMPNFVITKLVGVAKIFHVLKTYTDFFTKYDVDNKETLLKSLLIHDAYVEEFNGFVVRAHLIDARLPMGRAIYPTFSLFNHACSENAFPFFYGSMVVVKAKKNIKAGEQLFVNYGVDIITETKEKRQKRLETEYRFTCKCLPCEKDWPVIERPTTRTKIWLLELMEINTEVLRVLKIEKNRREFLLQRTIKIAPKLEKELPYTEYKFTNRIFERLLADGNNVDLIVAKGNNTVYLHNPKGGSPKVGIPNFDI